MQFNFNCEQCLDCDENGISILEGSCQNRIIPGYRLYVKEILDKMGQLSSKAQNLQTIITNTSRFFPSNHTLFIKAENNKVFGYVKVGPKKLFLRDRLFNYHERRTLCVLDFYVYENVQRKGIGKQIFDYMLNFEKKKPDLLAYDRPTLRLLSFLKKNYRLDNYIPQSNSFIIFDNFFSPDSIPNNDIEFDNDTNRVIQNLKSPVFFNTNNYQENNFRRYNNDNNFSNSSSSININPNRYNDNNKKYNDYNNREIIYRNNNIYNNRSYNMTENDYNHPRTMSPIGQQLVYSNDFTNNSMNKYSYKNPNLGSQSNRYEKDQLYNKRYNNEPLFDEGNELLQQNKNIHRSQDFINQKEYDNYIKNNRNSPRNYSNLLPKSPQLYRNQNNNNRNDDFYEDMRNRNNNGNKNINNNNNDSNRQGDTKKFY